MTREEELDWLYRLRSEIYVYMPEEWIIPMNNALDMAIKALEQEPSGDLISRVEAIKAIDEKAKRIKNEDTLNGLAGAVGILFDLPSVNPQEPKKKYDNRWFNGYAN